MHRRSYVGAWFHAPADGVERAYDHEARPVGDSLTAWLRAEHNYLAQSHSATRLPVSLRYALARLALLLVLLYPLVTAGAPSAEDVETWARAYSARYGANAAEVLAVLRVESRLRPFAVGDQGRSWGPAQWHCAEYDCTPDELWSRTPQAKAGFPRWDPEANVAAMAWAFAQARSEGWREHWAGWRLLRQQARR